MPWQRIDTEPLDIDTGVTPASARAIACALLRRAVPLMVRRDGRVEPLATATLYRIDGRVLLVTCRHIFDDGCATLDDLVIPLPQAHQLFWLARCGRRVLVHPQRDLALIELAPGAARDLLLRAWQPVPMAAEALGAIGAVDVIDAIDAVDGLDALDATAADSTRLFVVAGWPYAQMRRLDDIVYARPVVVFAGRCTGPRQRRGQARGCACRTAALRAVQTGSTCMHRNSTACRVPQFGRFATFSQATTLSKRPGVSCGRRRSSVPSSMTLMRGPSCSGRHAT